MSQNELVLSHCFTKQTENWFCKTYGSPTKVQEEAWPAIVEGKHILVSAPTGTGKTLSAFLVFIDRMVKQVREGTLKQELQLIYLSPLKSLAGDIRENLEKPLKALLGEERDRIKVSVRTGDTTAAQRRQMLKSPPHILITTPESLYLIISGSQSMKMLLTARAVIIDELHAMIDTKRGAHLMLSLARLQYLCGRKLQRIGLSATIEPLSTAAAYLSPVKEEGELKEVFIAAPKIKKEIRIQVTSPFSNHARGTKKDVVWEELSQKVYDLCKTSKSVIAFVEGRRFAEKLAYYLNLLGGENFARTHHGSLSKEQRMEVEDDLRSGRLKILCATSSMELGIDVGDIDQVVQVGCPRTISGTMQRLGRAGHNPGRVSVMNMFPRTSSEGIYCGLTAQVAREGGVEYANPPQKCFDVLAQHLVSMAAVEPYTLDEAMKVLSGASSFRFVTKEEVHEILCMLAGDYEHDKEIPARPRLLYDRIHEKIEGDSYSKMLAVSAGGTIPDRGMYAVKTREGVKVGELDEEFVFETNQGEKFLLGTFAWKVVGRNKDSVIVTQADPVGAKLPFWKGDGKGRSLRTSMAFGRIFRELGQACEAGEGQQYLKKLGLDEMAAEQGDDFIRRQLKATGSLPDDRTILIERFKDQAGLEQLMIHSLFGRQVNGPLSLLLQQEIHNRYELNIGCVEEEDGILIYAYNGEQLKEGLLFDLNPDNARQILEALLPATPVFNMLFRHNAARALMMGVRKTGRQPLWMQRLRSADMLDQLIAHREHPLIQESRRECLETIWDLEGLLYVMNGIKAGTIHVKEVRTDAPSPLSIPFQYQVEAGAMYDYAPTPDRIYHAVNKELEELATVIPDSRSISEVSGEKKLPESPENLHTLLMTEGDLIAKELDLPVEWFIQLSEEGRVLYQEPGIWIAAEHEKEYEAAFEQGDENAWRHIIRRMLRYRGAQRLEQIYERYLPDQEFLIRIMETLVENKELILQEEYYYHAGIYQKAQSKMLRNRRSQVVTRPFASYISFLTDRMRISDSPKEQLKQALGFLSGSGYAPEMWENVLFPSRVSSYRESLLDQLLAEGEYYFRMNPEDGKLAFERIQDIDYSIELEKEPEGLTGEEQLLYSALLTRGASFTNALPVLPGGASPHDALLNLVSIGLVCADSFVPVRQWIQKSKLKKAPPRQRISARVITMNAGRWDVVRGRKEKDLEEQLMEAFDKVYLLSRETASLCGLSWADALHLLRIWEYTGRARRGYFVEGLSGAQFIREKDYSSVLHYLEHPVMDLRWVCAADPVYLWGKAAAHLEGREVMSIPGNLVALSGGVPLMAMEKQGKRLQVFDYDKAEEAITLFVQEYQKHALYPSLKRIVLKEYPGEMCPLLSKAGFRREMQDYVLYL